MSRRKVVTAVGDQWAMSAADADASDPYEVDELFSLWLVTRLAVRTQRPLKLGTRRKFVRQAGAYLRWLRAERTRYPDALTTASGRDRAVSDYRAHLLRTHPGVTVNVALAALAAYYTWLELGPPEVPPARVKRIITVPLSVREQSDLLAAAQNRPAHTPLLRARRARNIALIMTLLYGGLEESEAEGLNIGDLALTGRSSHLWAPAPDGGMRRVELVRPARTALLDWTAERAALVGENWITACFLAWSAENQDEERTFWRLSVRQIEDIVRDLGREADLKRDIAPGVLRMTYLRHLIAAEPDTKHVARIMGQVKTDIPLVRTLHGMPLDMHPGRPLPRLTSASNADQLALDF